MPPSSDRVGGSSGLGMIGLDPSLRFRMTPGVGLPRVATTVRDGTRMSRLSGFVIVQGGRTAVCPYIITAITAVRMKTH
jgi:hypothetical protein